MKIIDDATQRIIDEVREKTKRKFDKSKLLLLARPDDDDDKPTLHLPAHNAGHLPVIVVIVAVVLVVAHRDLGS